MIPELIAYLQIEGNLRYFSFGVELLTVTLNQPDKGREAACKLQLTVADCLKMCMSALLLPVEAKYTSFIYFCRGAGNHALKICLVS